MPALLKEPENATACVLVVTPSTTQHTHASHATRGAQVFVSYMAPENVINPASLAVHYLQITLVDFAGTTVSVGAVVTVPGRATSVFPVGVSQRSPLLRNQCANFAAATVMRATWREPEDVT